MKPRTLVLFALISILVPILVWAGGSHTTAGYTPSRSYLHSEAGNLRAPLGMTASVALTGVGSAESLIVYDHGGSQKLLVGENDGDTAIYTQINVADGAMDWQNMMSGAAESDLNYVPAYAHGIVILGGPATTTVKAVYAGTGEMLAGTDGTLWEDRSVGTARGRYPIATAHVAYYAGEHAVVAVDLWNGPSDLPTPLGQRGVSSTPSTAPAGTFWRLATTTAEAPLSVYGERLYYQDLAGNLNSVSTRDGATNWTVPVGGSPNPNIIATEDYVFVNSNSGGTVGALDTETGDLIWGALPGTLSETPAMALAYDCLFLFTSPGGGAGPAPAGDVSGGVSALNASDGSEVWSVEDPGTGIDYGFVANNLVWYYNQDMGHIRVRDAFSGALVDSIPKEGVRGLSAAGGELFVLLENQVDVYGIVHETYFTVVADGGGQNTLITLNNSTGKDISGSLFFFSTAGNPLELPVVDLGPLSEVPFMIPALSAAAIATDGSTAEAVSGYALVASDGPLTGSSLYTFSDEMGEIVTEAGVANSAGVATATVYVEVRPAAGMAATVSGLAASLNTGVGVVNLSGVQNTLIFTLLDADANPVGGGARIFQPGEARGEFIDQIFPVETAGGFVGTVVITSDLPFAAVGIRTLGGLQLSSYSTGN